MTGSWIEANQRALVAELARIKKTLERRSGDAPDDVAIAASDRLSPSADGSSLERVCALFGLSPFERDVLLLCAGVELDGSIATLCAAANGGEAAHPTFGLALAVLDGPHWSALAPAAPLRRWRLVELEPGGSVTRDRLRIDERILHYLTGIHYVDPVLDGLLEAAPSPPPLPPSQDSIASRLVAYLGADGPLVQLCDADAAAKRAVAAVACRRAGRPLHRMRAAAIPSLPVEQDAVARTWNREAVLTGGVLLFDCEGLDGGEQSRKAAEQFVERLDSVVIVSTRDPLPGLERRTLRLDVGRPRADEQRMLWHSALGPLAGKLDRGFDTLAAHFQLDAEAIAAAAAEALDGVSPTEGDAFFGTLWEACRTHARPRLDDLAQRLEAAASWDDLVVPNAQRRTLEEIGAHVRHRATVYDVWGFAAKSSRGLGVAALFSGASGTGKTMAAEVLARELRLDLYRVDLSAVVSKYIGETEKNLRRMFDAAEGSGAILLFDEADALFGKRTEVKDSHDRFANIEVSYLLQRMEAYRGLAILTTNFESALDPAFLRRIRFVVQFPFPDAVQRREIWRRIFPAATPVEHLDLDRLAPLDVSGGNIRNIAMNAAFLAAEAGTAVSMKHLARAAQSEYAKLERPLSGIELDGAE